MMTSSAEARLRADPRRRLQHVRDHVAMREHRALRNAGRAAGVLQERDVVVSQRHGVQAAESGPVAGRR